MLQTPPPTTGDAPGSPPPSGKTVWIQKWWSRCNAPSCKDSGNCPLRDGRSPGPSPNLPSIHFNYICIMEQHISLVLGTVIMPTSTTSRVPQVSQNSSPGKWNAGKAYGIPVDRGKSNKNGWFALPRRVVVEKSEIIKQRKLSIPSHARGRVGEERNGMTEMLKVFKIVQSVLLCGSKYVVFDQLNSISVFRRSKNQILRIQL